MSPPLPVDSLALPFDQWTLATVTAAFAARLKATVGTPEVYEANRLLIERADHWRGGAVIPAMTDPALRARRLLKLAQEQAPADVANEIVDNDVNGLCGTEAAITFSALDPVPPLAKDATPGARDAHAKATAAEQADQDAMYALLSTWWDRCDFWGTARTALRYAEWAQCAALRPFVPGSALDPVPEGAPADARPTLKTNLSAADALALVALSAPEPKQAMRYVQPDTQRACALFTFTRDTEAAAELWCLTEDGRTQRRVLIGSTKPGESEGEDAPLDLGSALPLGEIALPRLVVTDALRAQQDALDFDGIAGRVATRAAGFRQRATTNAQPIYEWSRTAPTEQPATKKIVDETGATWYGIETTTMLGPEQVVHLTGEELEDTVTDGQGTTTIKRSLATPGIHSEDPVDSAIFTHMWDARRAIMLRGAKQAHLASDSSAQLSGIAYVQARSAFAQKLANAAGPFERAVRDTLTAVLAFADLMIAETDPLKGFLTRYRVQVTARVDAGPLTPEERQQYVTEWERGVIALPTLQARLGVQDTGAERALLDADPMVRLKLLEQVATTMAAIALIPGATIDLAARALMASGVAPELVTALTPQDTDGIGAAAEATNETSAITAVEKGRP